MTYTDRYHLTPEQSRFLAKKKWDENVYCGMKMENRAVTFPQTKTILEGVNAVSYTHLAGPAPQSPSGAALLPVSARTMQAAVRRLRLRASSFPEGPNTCLLYTSLPIEYRCAMIYNEYSQGGTNENSLDTGRRWVKNVYKSWEGTAKCSKAHEIS